MNELLTSIKADSIAQKAVQASNFFEKMGFSDAVCPVNSKQLGP
jgi:hypothetical protein